VSIFFCKNFCTFFLIGSNNVEVIDVVATATTAVVTAVTTTAVSGIGICISNTGIVKLGGSGCSVDSAFTSSGASRSLGGITIGLYDGIRAVGGLK
tara:strand:- start:532 stop:819 length:288 start_codon:yes stop_codon:yes gene_type:complete